MARTTMPLVRATVPLVRTAEPMVSTSMLAVGTAVIAARPAELIVSLFLLSDRLAEPTVLMLMSVD